MRLRLLPIALAVVSLSLLAAPARAQIGSATDIITGTVTRASDNTPVENATIEALSLETQVTRRTRTDARGRFTILFPDGGGQYRMTARVIGMNPRIEIVQRHADEDRLVWNVRLADGAVQLEAINVRATGGQPLRAPEGPTPGSTERAFNADQISRLPTDITDLNQLASLVPGVMALSATDSTATSFSVAGMGADANALTLDGLLFGSATVPQEGLRQTRVVTSTYDVSRGQFSGGLVASTTRSGSNVLQGSSMYQLRDEDLAVTEDEASAYTSGYTQHTLSGGLGGPIVRDRLFIYGSVQARMRDDPQQTLVSAQDTDYERLGVHPDSVDRFMSILQTLGVPTTNVSVAKTRDDNNLSALARIDYVLSNSHTATVRLDWRGQGQDPTRLGALSLPQSGGTLSTGGAGGMLTLTSRFGSGKINEGRIYFSSSFNDADPFVRVPSGRVQVASLLPDSSMGITTLVFGGNASLPTSTNSHLLDVSDELSWLPGGGGHRLKIGGNLTNERSRSFTSNNVLGTFTFNSLGALETNQPAMFRRTLDVVPRRSDDYRWGVYAGDVWVLARTFQLTYGARLEGSYFGNQPAYNPAVDSAFGGRTDALPRELHFSPRAGFSWMLGGSAPQEGRPMSPPTMVIRGGVGEFRSQPPSNLVAQARAATGLALSAAEVVCSGSDVPTPDWPSYNGVASGIPAQCASAGPTPAFQPARTVLLLGEDFEASRAWRGNLAVEKRLTQLFRLSVDLSFARGVAQAGYNDLNLATTPRFALASEGGRPVYVTPADITPTTGATRFNASRVDSAFGQVIQARSTMKNRSEQVTVGLGGLLGRGIMLNTSYTWQRASSQSTGIRGGNTAADPNVAEWARSDFERRHSVLATITYPLSQSVELTSIGRAFSGSPYTPIVGGDVNGDGARNDRAFVFTPGNATAEALGMQRLLASANSQTRSCLEKQIGTVASRASCTGPWQYALDFQLNWRPRYFGLNRRMTVSVVTVNFLRGLDELLHGADGAKGWGVATRPDATLLYVVGFDSVANRYNYRVNERFGATYGNATASRPPFQIGFQASFQFGPDRQRQALDAMRAGGAGAVIGLAGTGALGAQGAFRGPALNPMEMLDRLAAALPNPAGSVLELRDSLRLDSAQVPLLEALRDSLAAHNQLRIDSLRSVVRQQGNNQQALMRMMPVLRPLFMDARTEIAASLVSVRAVLTEEQWAKVPESVRNFQAGPGMLMGPGQGQGQGQGRPGGDRGRPRP